MTKWFVITFLLMSYCVSGQNNQTSSPDYGRLADELFPLQDQDLNYSEFYENMMQLSSNPIDINLADSEQLRFLNILTEIQIQNLVKYRLENGNLLSVYELQSVPAFDINTIQRILPFIVIHSPDETINRHFVSRIIHEHNTYLITRYERDGERAKGFENDSTNMQRFKGSPYKAYIRFRTSHSKDFSFGFTAEKDAGEKSFDYLSFHAQIQNKGRLKNLIVGDYLNQFGQGISLGGAFAMGKGSETITTVRRSNVGALPYSSVRETGFFRGVTATYELIKNIQLTSYYSRVKTDASLNDDSVKQSISSFITTGLHRNDNELKNRKNVSEVNYGSVLNYSNKGINIGVLFSQTQFNLPVVKRPSPYNQFAFTGTTNNNIGGYFTYSLNNFLLFGEYSQSLARGKGVVLGTIGSLTPKIDISLLYRKYEKDFYSFHTNAFSENTQPQNESGMYWGIKYKHNSKVTITSYYDLFKFPWLRFRSYAPSIGHEWLIRLNNSFSKTNRVYIQFREEVKARNNGDSTATYHISQGTKHNLWIGSDYEVNKLLSMKTRLQYSTYKLTQNSTKGMAIMQDVNVTWNKLDITGRYALFDTDDYDNRQYCYENDVWLAFSMPAYYGKGSRYFLLIRYKLTKKITLWARYSQTKYIDRNTIGSGADTITGNTSSEIKFQLRLNL